MEKLQLPLKSELPACSPLLTGAVWSKIELLEREIHLQLLYPTRAYLIPEGFLPTRDLKVLPVENHPPKMGLSSVEGQARLLHDLASIELQAMELALRSLYEFPEAPREFRQELGDLAISEARHLGLCLRGIENLGFKWGSWPVHLGLWQCVSNEDTLLDRILIVHRYLEGSGLDAGDTLLRRLTGVSSTSTGALTKQVVKTIVEEEVDHVHFGSRWFKYLCEERRLDSSEVFRVRLGVLRERLPKRIEPVTHELRKRAGFVDSEIELLEQLRIQSSKFQPRRFRTPGPRSE